MSYNIQHLHTTGRATIFTIITGLFCFMIAFIFNIGASEFNQAVAQQGDNSATTSVTVVNTPPQFTAPGAQEAIGSSITTPTNSGSQITFTSRAVDANGESYWLLICSENATPTPTGGNQPDCASGIQWAVSGLTSSAATATAATTTTETTLTGTQFAQENVWYAFLCDDNSSDQKCTGTSGVSGLTLPQQGTGTTSSPFYVNNPPVFSGISNNGPTDPGSSVLHTSVSSDTDNATTTDTTDTVQLFICDSGGFNYATQSCNGVEFASTTVFTAANATASDPIQIPTQDDVYNAFPYIIDNHGHAATSSLQGAASPFTVNNVAPFVLPGSITINNSDDMELSVEGGETSGFTLDFEISDNNSCQNQASTTQGEIPKYAVSLYRGTTTGAFGSTTCSALNAGDHDENDCYTGAATSTGRWDLNCTASTTACAGVAANDLSQAFSCTFSLWYIADPTDGTSVTNLYSNDDWYAQVIGIDDDNATGTAQEIDSGFVVDVTSFLAFDLQNLEIPYGALEPGQNTDDEFGSLGGGNTASSTMLATGNVGVDQLLSGSSMCPTFSGTSSPCSNSATSTIQDFRQVFATSSLATYALASSSGNNLSSTSAAELEINVFKSTSTSTPASGKTYWGVEIPGTISLSGDYTGFNTFMAVVGESVDWQ